MSRKRTTQTFDTKAGIERVDAIAMTCGEGERLQDLPMALLFHRLWEATERNDPPKVSSVGLRGWTIELDAYGFGVKLYVRILLDGAMSIFIEDSEGTTKVCDYTRAPLRRSLETGEAQ